jgi:hypothetical protein
MEDPHADDVLPWGNAATADSRCEIAFDVNEKEGDEAVDGGLLPGVQNTRPPAAVGVAPSPPTPPSPAPHPPPSDSRPSPSPPPSPSPAPPPPGIRLVTEESTLSSLDTCSNTSNSKTGASSLEEVVMLPGMVAGERARAHEVSSDDVLYLFLRKQKQPSAIYPLGISLW